jgi:transposase
VRSKRPKQLDEQWSSIAPEIQTYIEKLESISNRSPLNSSTPPSQSFLASKTYPTSASPLKRGAQKGHPGHHRAEETAIAASRSFDIDYEATHCELCKEPLPSYSKKHRLRKHQVTHLQMELEPALEHEKTTKIINHCSYKRYCERCRHWTQATIPADILKSRFSTAVISFVGSTSTQSKLSVRDIQAQLKEVFGIRISAGTVIHMRKTITKATEAVYQEIYDKVATAPVVYQDETSYPCVETVLEKIKDQNPTRLPKHWLWCSIAERASFILIHRSRSKEAQQTLPAHPEAVIVSDDYNAYYYLPHERRQQCLAHLIRNAQKFVDYYHPVVSEFALKIKTKLQLSLAFRGFGEEKESEVINEFQALVESSLDIENTAFTTFCLKLLFNASCIFTFIRHGEVEPTNNIAERALRKPVIKRKISLFAQSRNGLDFLAQSWSLALSCQQNDISYTHFLTETIQAHLRGQPAPRLFRA